MKKIWNFILLTRTFASGKATHYWQTFLTTNPATLHHRRWITSLSVVQFVVQALPIVSIIGDVFQLIKDFQFLSCKHHFKLHLGFNGITN